MQLKWQSEDKKSYVTAESVRPNFISLEMKFGPISDRFHAYCCSEVQASKWFAKQVEAIKKARNL